MKVGFIAVNYNNNNITTNYVSNVNSIRNIENHQVDIVIVDNFSEQSDFDELWNSIKDMHRVNLKRTDKNLGYFGGLNFGIKSVDYKTYDFIIAGNNDLIFERNFINKLEKKRYEQGQTVIVPDLLTVGGIHQNPQFIETPNKKRQLGYEIYYIWYPLAVIIDILYGFKRKARTEIKKVKLNKAMEIFQCTGACMIFTPTFFEHCGLLDDTLFLWGEEVALAHQLDVAGDKMLYDPELLVVHLENASVSKIQSYNRYKIWRKSYQIYKHYYK